MISKGKANRRTLARRESTMTMTSSLLLGVCCLLFAGRRQKWKLGRRERCGKARVYTCVVLRVGGCC